MSPWVATTLSIIAAYLIGAIPWPYIVVRLARGVDIRTVGDGYMGTTNVAHTAGFGAAAVVFLGDMAKGAIAVLLPSWLGAASYTAALAGPAAVAGHIWPVFLGFRGGGGAAVALGALWALLPREAALLFPLGALALWRARGETFFFNLLVLGSIVPLALLMQEPVVQWAAALTTAFTVAARQVQVHGIGMRGGVGPRRSS